MGRTITLGLMLVFLNCACVVGQELDTPLNPQQKEKIKQYKIAFITEKINLAPEQTDNFWQVYDNYELEKENLQEEFANVRKRSFTLTATDADITQGIETMFAIKQKQLDLEVAYKDKFLKVITIRQLAVLYQAEREFKRLLMERLRDD